MGGGYMPGQAYANLGYEYEPPRGGYSADAGWNGWDLAMAQYGGSSGGRRGGGQGRGLERDWFDGIINGVASYFTIRRLTESQAREAHRRIYHLQEPERYGFDDISARTLGGAAAFQAFLIWDRDHRGVYGHLPTDGNRERLVSMAIAEAYVLFERLGLHNPHGQARNITLQDCAETAAATAKYIFDHHYRDSGADDYHSSDHTLQRDERRHRRAGKHHRKSRSSGSSDDEEAGSRHHSHHSHHTTRSRHPHHDAHDPSSDYSSHHQAHTRHAPYPPTNYHHSAEYEIAERDHAAQVYRGGGVAAPGMMPGFASGMGHRPASMHGVPGMMQQQMSMQNPMMMQGMNPMMQNPMMYGGPQAMMQQAGMPMMGGPGMMGMGGQGGVAYPPNAGQMMENQMMAQHQAMHGQALPGMNPEYAHRMDGEAPVPGTRQYAESLAYGIGGMQQGLGGYPPGPMMGGAYGGGGMGGSAGMYGQPRGSWYGR
ncbi:hypothetical protein QFC22_005041 [Naganishia vaughanmartiniae]|uniref:Uncharacterized protein n=1 Tax=Naganishia vaughanmartiniae TaxID=1424756 RepID=A0ACC2WVW9_9TREE|nr:hypothetical protein QFC22_005041 [Naganishia vaughanmartiniae]